MRPPREFAQFRAGGRILLGGFIGCFQSQGLMDPVGVVVILKFLQLFFQIALFQKRVWSRNSRRMVPMVLSVKGVLSKNSIDVSRSLFLAKKLPFLHGCDTECLHRKIIWKRGLFPDRVFRHDGTSPFGGSYTPIFSARATRAALKGAWGARKIPAPIWPMPASR